MKRNRWPIGEVVRWKAGEIHPYLAELPHWRKVPKDPAKNLAYRKDLLLRCANSPTWRAKIWEMCAEDPVFWVNSFVWLTEPRMGESVSGRAPFITWCHQDPVMAAQHKFFGVRHMAGPKSRMQGASWMSCCRHGHAFTFRKNMILGLGSKSMDYADNADNPASLGWKVDYILDGLPSWMRPEHDRKTGDHSWVTPRRGSNNVIVAEAATGGMGRGARYTVHCLDESAFYPPDKGGAAMAVQNLIMVTNQIDMPSTPNGEAGDGGEFCERATKPSTWLRYILSWQDNPVHGAGMYTTVDGKLKILDNSYDFGDYDFILDGRVRSPWYDGMWYDMRCSAVDVARELDMDFGGSKPKPFSEELIREARVTVRDPSHIGTLHFEVADIGNANYLQFIDDPRGTLKLWCHIGGDGFPPPGEYFVGCDVAAGTGGDSANNSAASVFNAYGEQVAEFATNQMPPIEFARFVVALCFWFGRGQSATFLNWEKTGPLGMTFTREIVRLKYPNLYWQSDAGGKRHDNPGHHTNKTHESLGPLLAAMTNRQVTLRSWACVEECGQYVWDASGRTWVHPSSLDKSDPSAAGLSHGDRAMGAAMAVIGMNQRNILREAQAKIDANVDQSSIAGTPEHYWAQRNRATRKAGIALCRW